MMRWEDSEAADHSDWEYDWEDMAERDAEAWFRYEVEESKRIANGVANGLACSLVFFLLLCFVGLIAVGLGYA